MAAPIASLPLTANLAWTFGIVEIGVALAILCAARCSQETTAF